MPLTEIPRFTIEEFSVESHSNRVVMSGSLTVRDPTVHAQPHLRKIHDAIRASGRKLLTVDLRKLHFVNSSAIRLFIDWAMWVKGLPEDQRYVLRFRTTKDVTWQRTSFAAIRSIVGDAIEVVED